MADRRLYAQLTLDYADSHKIAPLSDAAFRAHVSMILWSRRMMTDGKIPAAMALVLAGRKPKVLRELTTNDPEAPSLVQDEAGDYWLHDFLDHQSSRAAIEAKQETNRANGARGGRAKAKRIATESLSTLDTESPSEAVADSYTESETETTTKTSSTPSVLETANSRTDDDADRSRRAGYWRGWRIANPDRLVQVIARYVDRPVSEDQAIVIICGLLAKASAKEPVRSVQAYVEGSLERSWAEIQRELDEAAVAA